jgi:two-component system response regulator AlgR
MRVLVVDDEKPARERLKSLLETLSYCQVCGAADNGVEALRITQTEHPDVVLMDIRMPAMDGLEAAHHLACLDNPPAVIFTTAYGEYALEAFDAHAIDYLLKPVRKERLVQALGNACKPNRAQLAKLHGNPSKQFQIRSHICAKLGDNFKLIPIHQILYFQADHKYVTAYHRQGEVIIEESLKSLETELTPLFLRIHRNALVALAFIDSLCKTPAGRFEVVLANNAARLEVSRRHLATLRQMLKSSHNQRHFLSSITDFAQAPQQYG